MKKILITIVIIILIIGGVFVFHSHVRPDQSAGATQTATVSHAHDNTLSYKGQTGKDALTLLKEKATVGQDHSGMVNSINGITPTGHHYWAFYVNGKMASVGPADYQTKNGDTIEWKIEKY